jgi:RNA polymerase sigma factor (TIGR02999 family)
MDNDDVSALLAAAAAGDLKSRSRLFEVVDAELKRIAARQMRNERANHTLQPSALVNEAYIRLLGDAPVRWENRAHFFTTASNTMRRILIDYARNKRAQKRDGALIQVELDTQFPGLRAVDPEVLLTIHAALEKLAAWAARQARVVELKWFGGLTFEEIAKTEQVSLKTVKRDWSMARAWLKTQISPQPDVR